MGKSRTRFAPSPTGYIHVGNLRSALYTYLIAKIDDGVFILRIEDTDRSRYLEEAVDVIYSTLKTTKLIHDEGPDVGGNYGPYVQSQRLDGYIGYALELVKNKHAYYCFCSEERIENLRVTAQISKQPFMYDGHCRNLSEIEVAQKLENKESYVIRQAMPKTGRTIFNDLVYGKISVDNDKLEDQILIKADGYPTYNFANVIDDYLMDITHVVRGNEYLSSTPKYCNLYDAFGWNQPIYVHLPSIVNEEGKKLSKRNNDASYNDLVVRGFLPDAIINYLALLGWSPDDNVEIFTLEELTKKFTIERISKSPSVFDINKLMWVNSKYIMNMSDDDYLEYIKPFVKRKFSNEELIVVAKLFRKQLSYGAQINEFIDELFAKKSLDEECINLINEDGVLNTISVYYNKILNCSEWTIDNIKLIIEEVKNECGVKGKLLFMPIRIASTFSMHGPDLAEVIWLNGKENVIGYSKQILNK